MGKIDRFSGRAYLLDEKISIIIYKDEISVTYKIDDFYYFLLFSSETKELKEDVGFGKNYPIPNSGWWRGSEYKWREMER